MNEELEILAERSKKGDSEAYSEIVRLLQQKIFCYCLPMIGNKQDAEDAVQEVFINAFDKLASYRKTGSFIGWVYTIAHNVCINKINRRRRLNVLLTRFRSENSFSQTAVNLEKTTEDTLSLLDPLNSFERSLIVLKVLHDKSYNEISLIVGGNPTMLRKKFERARAKLQRIHGKQKNLALKEGVLID